MVVLLQSEFAEEHGRRKMTPARNLPSRFK
jgi:hypothetical protein